MIVNFLSERKNKKSDQILIKNKNKKLKLKNVSRKAWLKGKKKKKDVMGVHRGLLTRKK